MSQILSNACKNIVIEAIYLPNSFAKKLIMAPFCATVVLPSTSRKGKDPNKVSKRIIVNFFIASPVTCLMHHSIVLYIETFV